MSSSSTTPAARTARPGHHSRRALYFSFYGGAFAWTMHLLGSWLIAEFSCLAQVDDFHIAGVTLISWSLLALSGTLLLVAIAAALTGLSARRRLQQEDPADEEAQETEIHFARSGAIMSGIFSLVITCQTIPIFFFLARC